MAKEAQDQLSCTHGHQSGFKQQPRPQISTRATHINMALAVSGPLTLLLPSAAMQTMGLNMDSGGWLHVPFTSTWPPMQPSPRTSPRHQSVAQTTLVHVDVRLHHGLGRQHGPQTAIWPLVAWWTTVVFRLRRSNPESGPLSGGSYHQAGLSLHVHSSRLLPTVLTALLGNASMSASPPSPVTTTMTAALPL